MTYRDDHIAILEGQSYTTVSGCTVRPLMTLDTVRDGLRIFLKATSSESYALVGGCAIMSHLHDIGVSWSEYRSSPDIDLIVKRRPSWYPMHCDTFLNHSLSFRPESRTYDVDCLLMEGPHAPLRRRVLMTSRPSSSGFITASPVALCAMKLVIPRRHLRPKDIMDLRLLVHHCLVTKNDVQSFLADVTPSHALPRMLETYDRVCSPTRLSAA